MILPKILRKNLMHEVIGVVLIHLDLFHDHAPLAGNVIYIEDGIQHQIAEHIHGNGHVLIENFDVKTNAFFGGEGIHVPADGIHLAGNLLGAAALGPFEDHMLKEMRDAVGFWFFVTRAGAHPDSDRN